MGTAESGMPELVFLRKVKPKQFSGRLQGCSSNGWTAWETWRCELIRDICAQVKGLQSQTQAEKSLRRRLGLKCKALSLSYNNKSARVHKGLG